MSFYKCTECNTFFTQKWPLLKGHLKNHHHHTDLDEAKVEDLVKYEITEQEYLTSTGKDQKGITVDNGTENREPPPPPPPGNQNPPPAGSTNPPLPEKITEYVDEPVERLRQVLIVNEAEPRKITTITNIMALSPWLWANWRDLEEMLVSHFGTGRRQWCQMVVAQYQAGVKIPQEGRYMYPYQGVPLPSNLGQPFNYQNPYLMPPGGWTPPAVNPEMSELKNELNRLREERQREHEKQYEDRIKELESKISGGSEVEKLRTEIEDLKKQLSGGGQANYMVIMDEKGQPMQLPYDRSFMEALRRKQEVETGSARTEQMLRIMAINGGGSDKYESMMAEFEKGSGRRETKGSKSSPSRSPIAHPASGRACSFR